MIRFPAKTRTRRDALERVLKHPLVDAIVMLLIVVSCGLLVAAMALPRESVMRAKVLLASDIITIFFCAELSLRWLAEPRKGRFWERYWIDVLAVFPAFRWFRFFWLLRLLRLFRFGLILTRRLSGYSALFRSGATETLILFVLVTSLTVAGALGIRLAEEDFGTFEQSMWWSVLSLVAAEPIGGTPTTTGGRLVALGVMMSGLFVFAVITGIVSANMVDRLRRLNLRSMELEDFEQHVVICGWNQAGLRVIRELQADAAYSRRGIVVIGEFDVEPDLAGTVPYPALVFFLNGDATRQDVLHKARIDFASRAIVLADRLRERSDQDRDARSVLTALLIENVNELAERDIFTSVELVNRDNAQSLVSAGVEEIVVGYDYVGTVMAASTRNVGMTSIIEELLTAEYGNQLFKMLVPESMTDTTVRQLAARLSERADAILIAIEVTNGDEHEMVVNPHPDSVVDPGAFVVVIARKSPDQEALL